MAATKRKVAPEGARPGMEKKSKKKVYECEDGQVVRDSHVEALRLSGFKDLPDALARTGGLYVARGGVIFHNGVRYPAKDSVWCNPFKIGKHGTREEVIEKCKHYLGHRITTGELDLKELKDKVLFCWCQSAKEP
jgi:hypothetical protein